MKRIQHVWTSFTLILTLATAPLLSVAKTSASIDATSSTSIRIIAEPEAVFPAKLVQKGIYSGYATIVVNVNNAGILIDWMTIEASHREFDNAIAEVINYWTFEPAQSDGVSINATQAIPVFFEYRGKLMTNSKHVDFQVSTLFQNPNSSPSSIQERDIARASRAVPSPQKMHPHKHAIAFDLLPDLDELPILIRSANPSLSQESLQANTGCEVLIGFYIDTSGRPRLPALVDYSGNPSFEAALAAQDAILRWQFEPPTRNGKPVVTKALQRFRF